MLQWLARRRERRQSAQALFHAVVAQARQPVFYARLGIPDTLEGRFEVLALHMFLVLERLRAEGADGRVMAQELVDAFVGDMDTTLRELGVGDLSIPKKVRRMTAAFYDRLGDYGSALPEPDPEALAAVVETYVYAQGDPGPAARVATYMRTAAERLRARSLRNLADGDLGLDRIDFGQA